MFKYLFSRKRRKRKQKPIYSNSDGMVQWDVWRNESQHGPYFRFSLGRRRRGLVNSYSPEDLLALPRMIVDLASCFEEQNAAPADIQRQLNWLADRVDFDKLGILQDWQPFVKAVDGKDNV